MANLTIGRGGEIRLPEEIRARYGLLPDTSVRIIETRTGILVIPITSEPMNAELAQELEEWQSLNTSVWDLFPYEDDSA
jgi:bifunctional DNA-binding transcriptional regulator/antitoxin component of YhaV-PrlF toxin-antitoxin module